MELNLNTMWARMWTKLGKEVADQDAVWSLKLFLVKTFRANNMRDLKCKISQIA